MTTVTTVTDLATPPLWHARRVTAGAASGVTEALAALQAFGLMPEQLTGESAHLLDLNDFDKARALLDETNEEESMATALDIAPDIDTSPATVRAWAKGKRLRVASMGTIPQAIVNAYLAAHGIPLAEQAKIALPTAPPRPAEPEAVTVEPAAVTPEPDPVTVEPESVTQEPDPETVEAGPIGTATVAGWDGRHRVMRVDHSVRGEVGWIAVSAWPLARFAILFEDDEISDFVPDGMASLVAEVERLQAELRSASAAVVEAQHDAETVRTVLLATEEQRNQNRVEANTLAVELADARQTSAQNREAMVVSTLPGPLPEEILELLAAWHALFAKATEVDTAAGHTLAEVALPALVLEAADQAHDLVRLLAGDVSR